MLAWSLNYTIKVRLKIVNLIRLLGKQLLTIVVNRETLFLTGLLIIELTTEQRWILNQCRRVLIIILPKIQNLVSLWVIDTTEGVIGWKRFTILAEISKRINFSSAARMSTKIMFRNKIQMVIYKFLLLLLNVEIFWFGKPQFEGILLLFMTKWMEIIPNKFLWLVKGIRHEI